jgi:CO/xanthine dehydrogenase FAD-binding subunit
MSSSVFIPPRHRPPRLEVSATLAAVLAAMANGARPIAGGTDVLVLGRELLEPQYLVWTGGVPALAEIEVADVVRIGAAVTLESLVRSISTRAAISSVTDGA